MKINSKKNLLRDILPPPLFMAMPSVGLSISNRSVRMVELKDTSKGLVLGRHAERTIPQIVPALSAESVESIKDADPMKGTKRKQIVSAITDLRRQFGFRYANVSLPDSKAYLFTADLPSDKLSHDEIMQSIEFQLEENVPMSASEAVFDYTLLRGNRSAVVAVFSKKTVSDTLEFMEEAGLTAVSLSINADAIAQAVIKIKPKGNISQSKISGSQTRSVNQLVLNDPDDPAMADVGQETVMIINIGRDNTGIYIAKGMTVEFTSTLNFGGEALTSAIQKQYSVARDKAIEMKSRHDFLKNKEEMSMFFSVINPMSALRDEIERVASYWQNRKDKGNTKDDDYNISRMILCGKDSFIPSLDEYLSSSMKVDVEMANVWTNVFSTDSVIPDISFSDSLDYAAAIGMALQSTNRY